MQDAQTQGHVGDLGNIFNAAHAVHQQSGGNDGDRGVLGAADLDLAVQRLAAADQILRQTYTFHSGRGAPARNVPAAAAREPCVFIIMQSYKNIITFIVYKSKEFLNPQINLTVLYNFTDTRIL